MMQFLSRIRLRTAFFLDVVSFMVKTALETDVSLMDDYTIQAWKLLSRIQENQFLRDPIVEAVFTQYFRDSVVTKSMYEKEKLATDTLVDVLRVDVVNL